MMNNIKTLSGLSILNTRPEGQNKCLSAQIITAEGIAIELPLLEIEPLSDINVPNLNTIDQAIFVSSNAVQAFFKFLQRNRIAWPNHIEVIAIGKSTGDPLRDYYVTTHHTPLKADSEHLLQLKTLQQPGKILLIKGEGGRPLIAETLIKRQASLTMIDVYRRCLPKINSQKINSLWHDDAVDIILLTSEQSLQHLFKVFPTQAHPWLRSKNILVISERLAKAAAALGITHIIHSQPNNILETLLDFANKDS